MKFESSFFMLEAIPLRAKAERGEELTADEQEIIRKADKRSVEIKIEEVNKQRKRQHYQEWLKENAIQVAQAKMCPLYKKECLGQDCAWFKMLKSEKPDLDGYYQYDAMCAICFPERTMRIDRGNV